MGSKLNRREDWPERLHDALLERSHLAFAWGSTDCLMTVCTLIQAMTGLDPAAEYRAKYSTEAEAMRVVSTAGCQSLEELVAQIAASCGYPEVTPKLAQRGDLVLFDAPEGTAFGLVSLNAREALIAGPTGLRFQSVLQARRAWRI